VTVIKCDRVSDLSNGRLLSRGFAGFIRAGLPLLDTRFPTALSCISWSGTHSNRPASQTRLTYSLFDSGSMLLKKMGDHCGFPTLAAHYAPFT
jgi:hypothetical protein